MNNQVDELILKQRRYISAKRAAKICDYANDYVGQLCREGRVEAVRVGRNWYVEEASILEHNRALVKVENRDMYTAHKNVSKIYSTLKSNNSSAHSIKNSLAVYTIDNRPLLPDLQIFESETSNIIPIRIEKSEIVAGSGETGAENKQIFTHVDLPATHNLLFLPKKIAIMIVIALIFTISTIGFVSVNFDNAMIAVNGTSNYVANLYNATSQGVDVVDSYEIVAKEINKIVDNSIYNIFYEI